ncbi:MAG: HAD family phosphatase [Gammaproteobacteria bacterium]|nr:HAD family phosphatase [Gammaproteobacteria bacterium]
MKNWIFDLGAVLLEWNPQAILNSFTSNAEQHELLMREIFQHPDWLAMDRGQLSEAQAIPRAAQRTNLSNQQISTLFDIVRESLTVIPDTLDILEKARANGLNLYCLSNMSPENYTYLKQKYAFFSHFHGVVISGMENSIKPEKKIYQILLERYLLNPEESLFIDDRPENILSAAEFGMSVITFTANPDCYQKLTKALMSEQSTLDRV